MLDSWFRMQRRRSSFHSICLRAKCPSCTQRKDVSNRGVFIPVRHQFWKSMDYHHKDPRSIYEKIDSIAGRSPRGCERIPPLPVQMPSDEQQKRVRQLRECFPRNDLTAVIVTGGTGVKSLQQVGETHENGTAFFESCPDCRQLAVSSSLERRLAPTSELPASQRLSKNQRRRRRPETLLGRGEFGSLAGGRLAFISAIMAAISASVTSPIGRRSGGSSRNCI